MHGWRLRLSDNKNNNYLSGGEWKHPSGSWQQKHCSFVWQEKYLEAADQDQDQAPLTT